jgi:hypothetical protein
MEPEVGRQVIERPPAGFKPRFAPDVKITPLVTEAGIGLLGLEEAVAWSARARQCEADPNFPPTSRRCGPWKRLLTTSLTS